MKTYEVELRALISKEQHNSLLQYFNKLAKGEIDNAKTYTFLTSKLNIKVKNQITKNKAKITVKKGAEYQQQVDETELLINPKDVENAVKLITALGFKKHISSIQKRINYVLDEIIVSLKHETNWKYHIEAEIVVKTKTKIPKAKEKLKQFFKKLGIKPMTEEETRTLINSIRKKYGLEEI